MIKNKYIVIITFTLLIFNGCRYFKSFEPVEIVADAYKKYVVKAGKSEDLKNVPQYMMLLPQGQDELAIELVPYLKKILTRKKISRKNFAITISKSLTKHKASIKLEKKIKSINPYFEGDTYGIIKKSLEYLRRGLPTIRDHNTGEINLFNYTKFITALTKMRSAWRNQDFSTLYFFHIETDREKFEKILNELKKDIPKLVKIAKILNTSGLRIYKMNFLKFYVTVMNYIHEQLNYSSYPLHKKILKQYFFFLKNDIIRSKDRIIYPDLKKIIAKRTDFKVNGISFKAKFTKNRELEFLKEGKYWRLPELPELFWKLPVLNTSR